MRTADDLVGFFTRNLGLGEDCGNNCNWLTKWYGMGNVPWCMITVSKAILEAGFTDDQSTVQPFITRTTPKGWAYVPYFESAAIKGGLLVPTGEVQRGDIVTYGTRGDPYHVGVCEWPNADGSIATIEGNYQNAIKRVRRTPESVSAIIRVPFDAVAKPKPKPTSSIGAAPPFPGVVAQYPPMKWSETARQWQARMRERGYNITVDGWYGRQSRGACLQFQAEKQRTFDKTLKVDGVLGPHTWSVTWKAPIT